MTEDEKMIQHWRNERRNHCEFPTQASYDDQQVQLRRLRKMLADGEASSDMIESYLINMYNYGKEGARRAVEAMERKNGQDNIAS